MKFKVSTKEKFTTITVNEANIYAKLTDNLSEICLPYLTQNVKNIICKYLLFKEEINEFSVTYSCNHLPETINKMKNLENLNHLKRTYYYCHLLHRIIIIITRSG